MDKPEESKSGSKRGEVMLACGALLGLLLALSGLLPPASKEPETSDVVAEFNGIAISRAEYEAALVKVTESLPKGKRMTRQQYRQLLDVMVEERLLALRAQELNLPFNDQRLRQLVASAMVEWVVEDLDRLPVSEKSLMDFFEANRIRFQPQPAWKVFHMRFACDEDGCSEEMPAYTRAWRAAHEIRRGKPFNEVKQQMADNELLALPGHFLSAKELHHQLGKTLAEKITTLKSGEVNKPIVAGNAYHLLMAYQRETAVVEFHQVRQQVIDQYRQSERQRELRRYLADLKEASAIRINETYLKKLELRDYTFLPDVIDQ